MKFQIKKLFPFLLFSLIFLPVDILRGFCINFTFAFEITSYPTVFNFTLSQNSTLLDYAKYFFNLLTATGILLALLAITFGGVLYLLSSIRGKFADEGKNWVKSGILGLLILLSSYLIAYTINPKLVIFNLEGILPLGFINTQPGNSNSQNSAGNYQEIPIGILTENLLSRTMDCYGFDQSGNPVDGDQITTDAGEDLPGPTYLNHDRADCLTQLIDGAQKKTQVIATLSDKIAELMNQCLCYDATTGLSKCNDTCGGFSGGSGFPCLGLGSLACSLIGETCDPATNTCKQHGGCTQPAVCSGNSSDDPCGHGSGQDFGACEQPSGDCPAGSSCIYVVGGDRNGHCYGPDLECREGETCEEDPGSTNFGKCTGSGTCAGSCVGAGCEQPAGTTDCCPTGVKSSIEHGIIETCVQTEALTQPNYDDPSFKDPVDPPEGSQCIVGSIGGTIKSAQNIVLNSGVNQADVQWAINKWNEYSPPGFQFFGSVTVNATVCNSYCCKTQPNGNCLSGTAQIPNNTIIIYNHPIDMRGTIPWNPAASTWYFINSGVITSEMNVDMANPDFVANSRMILLHELGHSLGLDDSYDKASGKANPACNGLSIMNNPRIMTEPGPSDITEINFLYGISSASSIFNASIFSLLPSKVFNTSSGCSLSGSSGDTCCTPIGYNGLDEFRCPNPNDPLNPRPTDPASPCSTIDPSNPGPTIASYVEKEVKVNEKTIILIDQEKWNKLSLLQQLTYFKEKITQVKQSIQKDINSLKNASDVLSACTTDNMEKSSVDILHIQEETKKQDKTISISKPFTDPENNKTINSSKYCNGFNYSNSSCLQQCQDKCPDSSPKALECYGSCQKCDPASPDYSACLATQKTCIEACYNSRLCIYGDQNVSCPGGSGTACNSAGGSGIACNNDWEYTTYSCGNIPEPCPNGAGDCNTGTGTPRTCENGVCVPGSPYRNCPSGQCDESVNKCKIPPVLCLGAGETCESSKCTIVGCPIPGETCVSGACRGASGICPQDFKTCITSCQYDRLHDCDKKYLSCSDEYVFCASQAMDNSQCIIDNYDTCLINPQFFQQCGDQAAAPANDLGNLRNCINNSYLCENGSNENAGYPECLASYYDCFDNPASYGVSSSSQCLAFTSRSPYSSSFLYKSDFINGLDYEQCPDPYEQLYPGNNSSCSEIFPQTAKCPANSNCPDCPCNKIDDTLIFTVPKSYDLTKAGVQEYDTKAESVLEYEMTSPQCSATAYNGDPLTFYCMTNFEPQAPIGGQWAEENLGNEIPVGKTVDDAQNWAKKLITDSDKMSLKISEIITVVKKIGDAIDDPIIKDYCACEAKKTDDTPICKTGCKYSESWMPTIFGYTCSCTFKPCTGKPCQQITYYIQQLWNKYKQLKTDFVNFYTAMVKEPRSDIIKELTYSRKLMDECSHKSTSLGSIQVSTFSCTKAYTHTTALSNRCYGILDGEVQTPTKTQTDNWFCVEQLLK